MDETKYSPYLQIVAAATNVTPFSGIEQSGKKGCITYLAKVRPIIAFVVGLKISLNNNLFY